MAATLVGIASVTVNLLVSFSTDGHWKTAGLALSQMYWSYVERRRVGARVGAAAV